MLSGSNWLPTPSTHIEKDGPYRDHDKRLLRLIGKYLRGWMNYFGISEYYRPIPESEA
jgi:hypothetical protein